MTDPGANFHHAIADTPSPGPLPPLLRPLGSLAAAVYGRVIARRNAAFDRGVGVVEFDRPTVSVGNLSVGGTGKTPTVGWLVRLLQQHGRRPCIAMRGYGASNGQSDEARLHAQTFPDVPVVARPNRTEGLLDLFASREGEPIDTVVLDDGFQHRRIARCFDLVLIDARKDPWADHLLPHGWLREPPASLARARGVLLTHAPDCKAPHVRSLRDRVRRFMQGPVACASHEWNGLTLHPGGETSVSWLRGKRVVACCAIGSPEVFLSQVRAATDREIEAVTLGDHDAFDRRTVEGLVRRARGFDAVVVTAKDWTKLERTPAASWPCPVAVPQLALRFSGNESELAGAILSAVDEYDATLRAEIEAERDALDDAEPTSR